MKALIICSVYALCDIARLERKACQLACEQHGIPVRLTARDHANIISKTPMLTLLGRLPGTSAERGALIESYLDGLNDLVWDAKLSAHDSVFAEMLDPKTFAQPTGFVSEYPMLTTNLVRAAALMTNATKLGQVTAQADPLSVHSTAESLAATAAGLGVRHKDIEVLVAHERDFQAARSLGMAARYVAERQPVPTKPVLRSVPKVEMPIAPIVNKSPFQHAIAGAA